MDKKEKREAQLKKLDEVANLLGAEFLKDQYANTGSLLGHLHFKEFKFRIYVSQPWQGIPRWGACFTKEDELKYRKIFAYGSSGPGVGISLNRSANAIVRDLKRRLFADAKEWYAERIGYFLVATRVQKERREIYERICKANRVDPDFDDYKVSFRRRMKGMWFADDTNQTNHANQLVAKVEVGSIEALEMIAAICAEDYEFHEAQKEKEK